MIEDKCSKCKWFSVSEYNEKYSFKIGVCNKSPFDTRDMKSNDMAIDCGHDGPVWVGENFGCVNYENKECEHNWISLSVTGKLHCSKCNEVRD